MIRDARRLIRGRRRKGLAALGVLLVIGGPAIALADSTNGGWNGQTAPNNPGYDSGEQNPLNACINQEEWFLYSFLPKCTPLARDPDNAAGMSIDQAWKQFTIGRPDVVIAYMEGGIDWHIAQARAQLAPRVYLNQGELPYPELANGQSCGRYDCNNDGTFNVYDYAQDPRVHQPYINADQITPEDLIVAFGDCKLNTSTHLIQVCRQGHHYDNDGDGYPNDISGWDFMYDNNDPSTGDGAYPHSDWQMERAAAEPNNGVGDVGICPGCMILPMKAGAEALDRTDRVAQTIYFAVDNHASVIVLLDAELGYSSLTQAALKYAWKKGVVVVGASNDFDSSDHQNGMFYANVWPGNGLVADGSGTIQATAKTDRLTTNFRSRPNETSFGPHALFSASNEGGSTSESTPTNAGVAALVVAEGRQAADQGKIAGPLSAGEAEQVVRATASNIDDPTLGWPGEPGATFNEQYGYGRPNVLKAMQAVLANQISPVPDIQSPDWYALYDPTHTSSVPIDVDIAARRATSFTWRVQYGLGPQPTEAQFHTIAQGSSSAHALDGVLAHLKLSQIPSSFWDAPFHFTADLSSTEQYDVTIRVQATDNRGNMGEDRRAIAVFHDPTIRRGFPVRLTDGAPIASPELADLQGKGRLDIVFGDSNGYVHAIDPDSGRELPGWPVHTDALNLSVTRASAAGKAGAVPAKAYEPILSPAAVGDLDGNGAQEVAATSTSGRVYVWNANGRLRPGFPRSLGAQFASYPVPPPEHDYTRPPSEGAVATPVLFHLPGSRTRLDIIQAAWDGYIYAFDANGRTVPGWPIDAQVPSADRPQSPFTDVHDYKIVSTPTLADLYGNGQREIVIKSQEFAYDPNSIVGSLGLGSQFYELAYWGNGNKHQGGALVPGFPIKMQGLFGYYSSAEDWITEGGDTPVAAHLPGTTGDTIGQNLVLSVPQFLTKNGVASQTPAQPNVIEKLAEKAATAQPGVDNDRVPTSTTAADPITFTTSGTMAPFGGHMAYLSGGLDLDSIGALIHNGIAQRITNFMFAYDAQTGKMLPGFGAPMMGLAFLTAPAVADVSGNGQPDVINNEDSNNVAAFLPNGQPVPSWPKFTGGWTVWTPAVGDLDGNGHVEVVDVTREGYLFVWNTPGKPSGIEAWSWHQNDWHTGVYGDDTRPPLVPRRARLSGHKLCFVAPGGQWGDGRAVRYDLRTFAARPQAQTFTRGKRVAKAPRPAVGGSRQCIAIPQHLPRGAKWLGLRAINATGLVGYPAGVRLAG